MVGFTTILVNVYSYIAFMDVPWTERSILWIIMTGLVLASFIFRKVVANDTLNMPFSVIISIPCAILGFVLGYRLLFSNMRYGLGIGLLLMIAGGFIGGKFMPDGES